MIIQSKKVWLIGQFYPAQIEIEGSKIKAIHKYNSKKVDIDYGEYRILPGFIDIHAHGGYGFDVNYADEAGLRNWLSKLPLEGVCSILPTTLTQSHEELIRALENVAKVHSSKYDGARIIGIHFEGPYLDMKYKGAQPPEHIRKPSVAEFKEFLKASNNLIKIITLAPEHDDNYELVHFLTQNNIVPSIGHSSCSYEQALLAISNGCNSMTHIFNGMSAFNHRENNLIGAALRFKDVFGEVIPDGNHSSYASLATLFAAKGRDRICTISDSLMAKGAKAGSRFNFGGHEIEVQENGSAKLLETGSLAGSTLKINEGLRILVDEVGVQIDAAINSCTLNPARLLKIDDHKAIIKAGYDADLVILDKDYKVLECYVMGEAKING